MSNRPNFLSVVQYSFYIFEGNYYAFVNTIEKYRNIAFREAQLIDLHLDGGRELSRLIHNYAASCFSLVDHSRIVRKKIVSSNSEELKAFVQEYDERVKCNIAESMENVLVKDLRNYVQHKAVLVPALNIRGSHAEPPKIYFEVPTSSLEKFDWKERSKEYINSNQSIRLEEIFSTHFDSIRELYLWIEYKEQQMRQHASEELRGLTFELWRKRELNKIIRNPQS